MVGMGIREDARGMWFFVGVGALIGVVLGILVSVTTDVPRARSRVDPRCARRMALSPGRPFAGGWERPQAAGRPPAQLNQRIDVGDVRRRLTGGAGEVSVDVRDGITAFSPIPVFSKGVRKIDLRFDASGFFSNP